MFNPLSFGHVHRVSGLIMLFVVNLNRKLFMQSYFIKKKDNKILTVDCGTCKTKRENKI